MAELNPHTPLLPSVLDRLIDTRPEETREAPKNRTQVMQELRASVQRDLAHLLNTRGRSTPLPVELTELPTSLVNYGIPDIMGADLQSQVERSRFLARVEQAIRTFEPRFQSIKVVPLDNADYLDRTLRFRIDAVLRAEPAPEPIVFDSSFAPETGSFSVTGGTV